MTAGVGVSQVPSCELLAGVRRLESTEGATFMHPFDDLNLISGHASLGLEVRNRLNVCVDEEKLLRQLFWPFLGKRNILEIPKLRFLD